MGDSNDTDLGALMWQWSPGRPGWVNPSKPGRPGFCFSVGREKQGLPGWTRGHTADITHLALLHPYILDP